MIPKSPKVSKLPLLLLAPCLCASVYAGGYLEAPEAKLDKKFHLLGLTLTPGGFVAAEGLWRQRAEQSDIGSSFSGIPLGNNPLYYMNETRFTGRQSRVAMLIEGEINPNWLLSGYYEADFLGTGTANSNESNSYDLRQRVVYATLDSKESKSQLLAGQSWSLATTNFKGITPRNESIPPTIDAQYVVGFVWKRQAQFRLTKEFGDKVWAAVSVENPQVTYSGSPSAAVGGSSSCSGTDTANNGSNNILCSGLPANVNNIILGATGTSTLPSTTTFSLNRVPDVVAKVAYETKFGEKNALHIEGIGLYRSFYDRVEYSTGVNENKSTSAGGGGAGAIVKVFDGKLELQGNYLRGRGIGTYASGQLPDATIKVDGALAGIPETVYMVGATLHVTPHTDFYVFGGREKEDSRYFVSNNNLIGYGLPNADNTGCRIELGGKCKANTHKLEQITVGTWHKFYQGVYGDLRGGLQYSYTKRDLFTGTATSGISSTATVTGYNANEQMVFASLRYYPFTV